MRWYFQQGVINREKLPFKTISNFTKLGPLLLRLIFDDSNRSKIRSPCYHGIIIRTEITWNNIRIENSFIKHYWIRHGFEVERHSLWTKSTNISRYQTANLLKTRFLFLVCKKGQKENKTEFVTKCVGNILTIIFTHKYLWNC